MFGDTKKSLKKLEESITWVGRQGENDKKYLLDRIDSVIKIERARSAETYEDTQKLQALKKEFDELKIQFEAIKRMLGYQEFKEIRYDWAGAIEPSTHIITDEAVIDIPGKARISTNLIPTETKDYNTRTIPVDTCLDTKWNHVKAETKQSLSENTYGNEKYLNGKPTKRAKRK